MDCPTGSLFLIDRERILLLLAPISIDHKQSGEPLLVNIEQILQLSVFYRQFFIVCWSDQRGEENFLAVSEIKRVCNCILKPSRGQLSLIVRRVDQH